MTPQPADGPVATPRRKRWLCLVVVFAFGCLLGTLLAGPVTAEENGPSAPTLQDGSRHNASVIELTVADDDDVDESSIEASDFSLSDGRIDRITTDESGSNARVKLFLENRLDTDEVTVEIAGGGNVTDAAGNGRTSGSVTVTGMDSFYPHPREYDVTRLNASHARIDLRASEPLAGLRLTVDGPASANLTLADFREVENNRYGVPYVAVHHFPEDGEYRLRLRSLTDEADHLVNYTRDRSFVRDASAPVAAVHGPSHASTGDLVRFDGSGSTDNVGVTGYHWRVDGDDAGDGSAYEHAFATPGTHNVTLTVVDGRGNESATNHSVTVHRATSKDGVEVSPSDDGGVRATITDDRTRDRVRVADAYGRLLDAGNVTLDSLTVSHPANESVTLNLTGTGTAPAFENATGNAGLAAFTVDHGNETLEHPTFRFSVPASRLAQAGVSYADVSLYRDDGNWSELDTRVVRATESAVVYEATAPGLSTFVVGTRSPVRETASTGEQATGAGAADVAVTDATLLTDAVDAGGYAVVEATFANAGDRTGTYVAGVTIGPDVALTRPVVVPPGESQRREFVTRDVRNGTVAVNGTVAGELSVRGRAPADTDADTDADADVATDRISDPDSGDDDAGWLPTTEPNPLALWPDGFVGAVLTGVVGVVAGTYGVLKALAIYLGY